MQSTLPSVEEIAARDAQMFPSMSDAMIARVRRFGAERLLDDGEMLWEQGQYDVPFYVVLEGRIRVEHPHADQTEIVTSHDPRGFTGEIDLVADRRSLVQGRAIGRTRVLAVERPRFRALVQSDGEISELLIRAFILRRVALLAHHFGDAVMVGSRTNAATLRLQEFMSRNGQPYEYVDLDDASVQSFLDNLHVEPGDIPVLICRGEKVLKNPSNAEVADCLGFNRAIDTARCRDVVIVGAGPAGLAAAVYAASEGLDVLVLEAASPGGQAGSSSKIENYLGFPTGISGNALMSRALTQAEKFGARIAIARGAARLDCSSEPYGVHLESGDVVCAKAVVIATGAQYRRLELANLARFEAVGVYYAASFFEASRCEGEEVIVVGGGNSAGQAATYLARSSRRVHVMVRAEDVSRSMSRYLVARIEDTPNITLHTRTRIVELEGEEHLSHVTIEEAGKPRERLPIRHVFSMTGAKPNTEWLAGCVALDDDGFVLTSADLSEAKLREAGWSAERAPYLYETTVPRVFAVGDVRANSVKRVASAVGEGSVCIQFVHKVMAEAAGVVLPHGDAR